MDILRLTSSIKDVKSFNLWQSLAAEFLGTFVLVFIGFGSAFDNQNPVKVGLGFGLAGVVCIYWFGPISGGHINPAVSFGLLIARQISLIRFILYFIIQVLGAIIGFKLISLVTNGNVLKKSAILLISNNNMTNKLTTEIIEKTQGVDSPSLKMICELIITLVLVLTVFRMCVEKTRTPTEKGLGPLIIGLSISIGVYCGMNISGGSMNPAASLGVYFCAGAKDVWTQIVGPLLGGLLAALLHQLLFTSDLSVDHIKNYLLGSDFENADQQPYEAQKDTALNDFEKKNKNQVPEEGIPSKIEEP